MMGINANNISDRYLLINRISNGLFTFSTDNVSGTCRDLQSWELAQIENQYDKDYAYGIENNLMSDKEAMAKAIKDGIWEPDWSVSTIDKQIKMVVDQMKGTKFQLDLFDKLNGQKEKLIIEKNRLSNIYNTIMEKGTARYYALKSMAISKVHMSSVDLIGGSLSSENTILLVYGEISDHEISTSTMRKIARSSPWITLYKAAKDGIGTIFPDLRKLTAYQERLLSWTQLYEYVYNSMDKPDKDVIEDDDRLDVWLEEQDKEKSRKGLGKTDNNNEQFVMSDRRGAKKVYDMNSKSARAKVKKMMSKAEENGTVLESEIR